MPSLFLSDCRLAAAAIACLFSIAMPLHAGEITLRMKNGDFQLKGELVAYDNAKYTIMSKSLGSMTLDANRFDCIGDACPTGVLALRAPSDDFSGAANAGPSAFAISGSNTIGNQLMPNLIEAYAQKAGLKLTKTVGADPLDLAFDLAKADGSNAGKIALHRHGSSTAFTDMEKKVAEIGMASRPVKGEEVKKFIAAGLGNLQLPDSEHVLGLDGLVVLVSPDNPLVSLPVATIAKIFAGEIKDWSEIGQPAGKINVYAPTKDSGTFDTFEHLVLKPNKLELTTEAKRTANHAEQADWVAHDRLGIGFAGIAYMRNAKPLNIVASCGLISQPTIFNIKTEEYPLSRRLFLYTMGQPRDPLARQLLSFALSGDAQGIVKQADFIDQVPETAGYDTQTGRIAFALNALPANFNAELMQSFTNDIQKGRRLSLTFRFHTGSYTLDNKALADVKRLVNLQKDEAFTNKDILLAGFADTQGLFSANVFLSQNRARAVLAALKAEGLDLAKHKISIKGYGELAPAACNDTPEGMQINRRVEVWLN